MGKAKDCGGREQGGSGMYVFFFSKATYNSCDGFSHFFGGPNYLLHFFAFTELSDF